MSLELPYEDMEMLNSVQEVVEKIASSFLDPSTPVTFCNYDCGGSCSGSCAGSCGGTCSGSCTGSNY
jgi:hypothetical protein